VTKSRSMTVGLLILTDMVRLWRLASDDTLFQKWLGGEYWGRVVVVPNITEKLQNTGNMTNEIQRMILHFPVPHYQPAECRVWATHRGNIHSRRTQQSGYLYLFCRLPISTNRYYTGTIKRLVEGRMCA